MNPITIGQPEAENTVPVKGTRLRVCSENAVGSS
jgi:hypothetical protein